MCLDETGITTNLLRRYGRAPRGARVHDHAPCGRWQTSTFLAALRVTGLTAPGVFDGAIDGESFRASIDPILVPTLHPGDIVIADNLGAHQVAGIQRALQAAGPPSGTCHPTARTSTELPATKLLFEDPVLLDQVGDNILLMPMHPARNRQQEQLERESRGRHSAIVGALNSHAHRQLRTDLFFAQAGNGDRAFPQGRIRRERRSEALTAAIAGRLTSITLSSGSAGPPEAGTFDEPVRCPSLGAEHG